MPSRGEGRTFEPRGPGPPAGRGRGHGSGASSASPTAPTAPPMLSTKFSEEPKIFRAFSNDWKKFSAQGERKGSAREKHKGGGREGRGRKAGGGKLQEYLECRFAGIESCRGAGGPSTGMIRNKCSFNWAPPIFVGNQRMEVERRMSSGVLVGEKDSYSGWSGSAGRMSMVL
jgi:hypothetical protein